MKIKNYFRKHKQLLRNMLIAMFLINLTSSLPLGAEKVSVAVLNFSNRSDSPGLNYLSASIPDSISSALSEFKEISLVERRHLGKVLKQIELEHSGLLEDEQITQIGKFVKADILIMGAFSGNPEEINLSIKAVKIATSEVIAERMTASPLSTLFDRANQISSLIGAIITGQGVGSISVESTPRNADVYIDGMKVGRTPIIEMKVRAGEHSVKVARPDYLTEEKKITVKENEHEKWDTFLAEDVVKNRGQFAISVFYLMSPDMKEITPSTLYSIMFARSFNLLVLGGEVAFGSVDNNVSYNTLFNSEVELNQWYSIFYFGLHLGLIPFPKWRYFSPYLGGFVGYGSVNYLRDGSAASEDDGWLSSDEPEDESIKKYKSMINCGGKFVINFFPFSRFNIFFDLRYIYYPKKMIMNDYEGNLFGPRITHEKEFFMQLLGIGGGIKFYF